MHEVFEKNLKQTTISVRGEQICTLVYSLTVVQSLMWETGSKNQLILLSCLISYVFKLSITIEVTLNKIIN